MSILPSLREAEQFINNNMHIDEDRKNHRGEVFTSAKLVHEILDNLPSSVWKNPHMTWLDPAAGSGHFMVLVYAKCFQGLENVIKNDEKRKRHILDNMLFMVELDGKNIQTLHRLFGKDAHICKADFLGERSKWERAFGRSQFNVVVGNPPFQTEKSKKYVGSVGHRTLWDKFVVSIFDGILQKGGYLGFLTPANWRRPEHSLYKLLTQDNSLRFLHIYGKKDGLKELGAQTRFDCYVVQEGMPKKGMKTTVKDELGQVHRLDLASWPFLPNFAYEEIASLLVPRGERSLDILFDAGKFDARYLSKKKTRKYGAPVVHNITHRGLGLRYGKKKEAKHHGVPKVILNFNEKQYPYNDYRGEYGMSQLSFAIPILSKAHGEKIVRAISSPAFQDILRATKWSSFQTDYRMFFYFDRDFYKDARFLKG